MTDFQKACLGIVLILGGAVLFIAGLPYLGSVGIGMLGFILLIDTI